MVRRRPDRRVNKRLSAEGEIFGGEVTATVIIYRLVHHAAIAQGRQLPPQDRDLARPSATNATTD